MRELESYSRILGAEVSQLYLVVWPPEYETTWLSIDISVGLILKGISGDLLQLRLLMESGCEPTLTELEIGKEQEWKNFDRRVKEWMIGAVSEDLEYEYHNVTEEPEFNDIVGGSITSIEYLVMSKSYDIYAIRIGFDSDYIIVSSISDGSTVETKRFNRLDNIDQFLSGDEIEWIEHSVLLGKSNR